VTGLSDGLPHHLAGALTSHQQRDAPLTQAGQSPKDANEAGLQGCIKRYHGEQSGTVEKTRSSLAKLTSEGRSSPQGPAFDFHREDLMTKAKIY